ncbi:MAG: 7-cyano-7-deazaguanine synthase QueC [Nitrososphaerota archaeon]|nr:7-cyano-7-deazaguanine synthase QueC [Nitrososphaerota archaeon]MDG6939738.1 7-cyano-7-deazaguanine synthase QueC [Nitrososphaerota archaeon]
MKAIVLLSGGIDSATALYSTVRGGAEAHALTFDYELRQSPELAAAERIARAAGVSQSVVELPFYKSLPSSPSSSDEVLEDGDSGISSAYVPARNAVFFGIAAAYAEALGAGLIVSGHNGQDAGRFPDAGAAFLEAMNGALSLGMKGPAPEVKMPLKDMTKTAVVGEAIRLGVPLELTWSCYNNGKTRCGGCYGCTSRAGAFAALGMRDPLEVPA